jgi:sugar phosphate isomerase/epimerase
MRWSYPFGTRDTGGGVLGARGDVFLVFDALASAGYDGVELLVRDPAAAETSDIEAALQSSGLVVAAIGTGPVAAEGLTLTSPESAVRRVTVERLRACIDLAQRFGAGVNLGKVRGLVSPYPDQAWAWMGDGLRRVADHAAQAGVCVTIEPQSSPGLDNIQTTAAGVAFVREFAHPSLQLMIDAYHAEAADRWPSLAYVVARDVLRHVHFADTGRLPPGRGTFNLELHLATLTALDYSGFITFEINQLDDPLSTARESLEHMMRLQSPDAIAVPEVA